MKKSKLLVILTLLSIIVAGCSTTSTTQPAQDGKLEITIGRAFDINGLDPGFLTENAQVVDNIFDTLVKRDDKEQLVPGLATSWSQVNDTTWEFKLRKGVTFTNGEPFNADVVKYTIDRVLNPKNNAPTASYISTIKEVKVVDEYTVHVITKKSGPVSSDPL
ncbi:ABC transporter substrate-binding protein [Paenibacillus sp. RC343]|uniref:ABC transporter substrate-binding protein n=1 Tax=Paenibacillus sp. RC343 TaxID=3045841 RepID=UPI0024B8BC29|nr:ABC transporter substrate-binding protein [Paenibacillus sp. RC343]